MRNKAPGLPLAFERGMTALAEQAVNVVEGSRRCSRCRRVKPLAQFAPRYDRAPGWQSWCRQCVRIGMAEYRQTERAAEVRRAYRQREDVKIARAEQAKKYEQTPKRRAAHTAYWQSKRGRIVNARAQARSKMRAATTDTQRAHYARRVAAHDAELARMNAAREREVRTA